MLKEFMDGPAIHPFILRHPFSHLSSWQKLDNSRLKVKVYDKCLVPVLLHCWLKEELYPKNSLYEWDKLDLLEQMKGLASRKLESLFSSPESTGHFPADLGFYPKAAVPPHLFNQDSWNPKVLRYRTHWRLASVHDNRLAG